MHYRDFIIKIENKSGEDYAISIESPAGEGNSVLRLPFELDTAAEMMLKLAGTFRGSTDAAEQTREMSWSASGKEPPIDLPKALFDCLFTGTARSLFDQSLGMMRGDESGLRIKLQIDPTNSEIAALASLPWELLYREETRDYLSLSRGTPLVRYLNVQRPFTPQAFKPPLRVLVVMASPEGVAELNLDQERKLIEHSWARQGGVEVDFLERPATTQRLSTQLSEKDYHVLHYMGHGDFDRASGHGVLLLEDENNQPVPLDGQTLGGVILHDVKSLRLVFLNACDTAKATKLKGQDPFAGVATAMIMGGIPAVVAMQFPITDKAAVEFAGTFYPRIVQGYPVDAAVAEGRKAIRLADPSSMEWATPVLFMRSPDGVLFDIETPDLQDAPPLDEPASASVDSIAAPASVAAATSAGMPTYVKGLIGAGAALLLAIVAYFMLGTGTPVPDISADGYTIAQATKLLEQEGLKVAASTKGETSARPEGVVISTLPLAGSTAGRNKEITLVVSDGTIKLADFAGQTQTAAVSNFEKLPLAVATVVQELSDKPPGTVLRSDPAAGQVLAHDTPVTLYVSASGIKVPDVVTMDPIKAMEAMTTAGLKSELQYELSLDGNPGKIFRTEPAAAVSQVPDEPVVLFVSARGGWMYLGRGKTVSTDTMRVTQGRNLRALDDDSGANIGVVKAGETVKVLESRANGWTKIQADGT